MKESFLKTFGIKLILNAQTKILPIKWCCVCVCFVCGSSCFYLINIFHFSINENKNDKEKREKSFSLVWNSVRSHLIHLSASLFFLRSCVHVHSVHQTVNTHTNANHYLILVSLLPFSFHKIFDIFQLFFHFSIQFWLMNGVKLIDLIYFIKRILY